MLISWADFRKDVRPEDIRSVLSAPLWFNTNLRDEKNLYVHNWDNSEIKTIGDLLDNTGNFYTFDRLKEIYRVRGPFLTMKISYAKYQMSGKIQ